MIHPVPIVLVGGGASAIVAVAGAFLIEGPLRNHRLHASSPARRAVQGVIRCLLAIVGLGMLGLGIYQLSISN